MTDEFFNACREGDLTQIQRSLEQGVDPSMESNKAIRMASAWGYVDIVKLLLQDSRVDPTVFFNYALRWACNYRHLKVIEALLQDGRADPTVWNNEPLYMASVYGHIAVVSLLLQDGRVEPTDISINHASPPEIKDMLLKYKYRVDGQEYCRMKNEI